MATFCPWRRVRASGESNRALTPRINPAAPANPAASPPPPSPPPRRHAFGSVAANAAATTLATCPRSASLPARINAGSDHASTVAASVDDRCASKIDVATSRSGSRSGAADASALCGGVGGATMATRTMAGRTSRGAARRSNSPSQSARLVVGHAQNLRENASRTHRSAARHVSPRREDARTTAPHRRSTACASGTRATTSPRGNGDAVGRRGESAEVEVDRVSGSRAEETPPKRLQTGGGSVSFVDGASRRRAMRASATASASPRRHATPTANAATSAAAAAVESFAKEAESSARESVVVVDRSAARAASAPARRICSATSRAKTRGWSLRASGCAPGGSSHRSAAESSARRASRASSAESSESSAETDVAADATMSAASPRSSARASARAASAATASWPTWSSLRPEGFRLGASAGTRTRAAIAGGDARRISSWSDARCAAVRHGSHVATTAWHISSPHGSKPDHANAGSERRAAAASAAREPSTGDGEASPARREAPLEASSSSSRSATPRTSVRVSNTSPGARASLSATAAAR